MSRMLKRDPFSREELHTSRVYNIGNNDCLWCGKTLRTPKKNRPYLMRFFIVKDGQKIEQKGWFCSKSCFDSY